MYSVTDLVLQALLGLVVLGLIISAWRFHNNDHYRHFNLIDLVTNREGKISRPAMMELGAFVLMTWGFVVLITKGALTEWYAGLYVGAFVMRAAYSSYLSHTESGNGKVEK